VRQANGPARLVRRPGNDPELNALAARHALAIGAGHAILVLLGMAPVPGTVTSAQLSRSATAATAGSMARSRTLPKPSTSAGGAAAPGWPR
jgi:adenosine/AMP kinase